MSGYEPPDDPEYERWLIRLSKECKCAPCCNDTPCAGLMQGAFCDQLFCMCGDESPFGDDDENERDEWESE